MKQTSLLALALVIGAGTSAFGTIQVTETFDTDPAARGWAGVDNRTSPQDYGFSTGDVTGTDVNPPGGTATGGGEFGGTLKRQNPTFAGGKDNFYGVDLGGSIDISTDAFSVSGVIHLQQRNSTSGFLVGYSRGVESYTDGHDTGDAKNFIGLYFDDCIDGTGIVWSATGARDRDIDVPDLVVGTTLPFSMAYDPNGNGGNGALAVDINGVAHTFNLPGGTKNDVNVLTHFGIMPVSADGDFGIVWVDDLTYTAVSLPGIPGDVNDDGFVDIFDINFVSGHWNEMGTPPGVPGDANDDGKVDIFDINLISSNWMPNPGGAAAVPEPGSLALAALALTGVVWMGGRRASRRARQS